MRQFTRIQRLPPYVFNITAELKMAARRRGEDIIDMSMGNPDGATPAHIVAKLAEVAQRPDTHGYSASKGIPRLRRAISHWYEGRYGVAIDPDREAIVTIGSKEGLAHLMLATLDRGDTVLVPDPSYPIHIYGAVIAGGAFTTGFGANVRADAEHAIVSTTVGVFHAMRSANVLLGFRNAWLNKWRGGTCVPRQVPAVRKSSRPQAMHSSGSPSTSHRWKLWEVPSQPRLLPPCPQSMTK